MLEFEDDTNTCNEKVNIELIDNLKYALILSGGGASAYLLSQGHAGAANGFESTSWRQSAVLVYGLTAVFMALRGGWPTWHTDTIVYTTFDPTGRQITKASWPGVAAFTASLVGIYYFLQESKSKQMKPEGMALSCIVILMFLLGNGVVVSKDYDIKRKNAQPTPAA